MRKVMVVLYGLLLTLAPLAAQAEKAEPALPNWLTGIIAVAGFLFLVFVVFLVNKAWCGSPSQAASSGEYSMTNGSSAADRSSDNNHVYENEAFQQTDEKITVM